MKKAKAVKVKRSRPGCGLGLFVDQDIEKKAFVIEYTGNRIRSKVADTLGTKYLFDLENGFTLDGSARSNLARYINHSCGPNVEAELDGNHIYIYALRNIESGEEMTIDYGEEYFDEFIKPYGCKCDSCSAKEEK